MTIRRLAQFASRQTPHARLFGLMSEALLVETNDADLLEIAEASFGRFELTHSGRPPLVLRMFREDPAGEGLGGAGGRRPRLRHQIDGSTYVVSGSDDAAAVDGESGHAVVFLSAATAADRQLVRYSFVEGPVLAMLIYGRGYFVLHASGVARNGVGIALAGREGAGKSTLAVAAARRGLDVFAEDGVFVRAGGEGLEFWGVPWTQRIVREAVPFFPEFADATPIRQPNGEMKVEIDVDTSFPGRAVPRTTPGAIVVLRRGANGPARLERISAAADEVAALWPWGDHWTDEHEQAARMLVDLPTYALTINGHPDAAIDQLEVLLEELSPQPAHR